MLIKLICYIYTNANITKTQKKLKLEIYIILIEKKLFFF